MRRTTPNASRRSKGMSLLEMLVSVSIVSLVSAGIAGLVMLNGMASTRLSSKTDDVNAARNAMERISKDVRMARNIGGVFGAPVLLAVGPPEIWGTEPSDEFPSTSNPLYGAGQQPPGGWPSDPWPAKPYKLGARTLIVQIPVFDANGFPTMIRAGTGNPVTPVNSDNLDTLVYQVLPDPSAPGEYMMQIAGIPGSPTSLKMMTNPPQTILKGIVGPKDPETGEVVCFQYLDRTDPSGTPITSLTIPQLGNVTGVIVVVEVKRADPNTSDSVTVACKSEMFMRNNKLSTTSPPNL